MPLREALVSRLSRLEDMRIETADSAEEAEELLAFGGERFACAVLDFSDPVAGGNLLDLLRAHEIPVIAFSGSVEERTRQHVRAGNIVDYVVRRNAGDLDVVADLVDSLRENHRIKVIVADGSSSERRQLQWLLESHRYQVFTASNGRDALRLLKRHPDTSLVIADAQLPFMSGFELIEAIRAEHRRDELAILGMAAESSTCAAMLKLGANDFLCKPFEAEQLQCRVAQNVRIVEQARRIREDAIRDQLTGLYNRRHLLEVGKTYYANACRGNVTMAVALIDVDHLDAISHTHGEPVGHRALRAIAHTTRENMRLGDVTGRYAEQQMLCLAMVKRPEDATAAFERVRRAVEGITLHAQTSHVPLSASIGVTTDRSDSLEQMISRADAAMHQARAAGHNRVVACA